MLDNVQKAIQILQNGGVVIFPTDTAYGIGCRIDDEKAVERVFSIKGRDFGKAVPVLVSSIDMAKRYVKVESDVKDLMKDYWPGGLTIVLPATSAFVSPLVKGSKNTLAVRIPDKKEVLEIITKIDVPIIGTSANFAGEKTPFSFEELDQKLVGKVDFVLKGTCEKGMSSTVLDATQKPWKILRQGAVEIKMIDQNAKIKTHLGS